MASAANHSAPSRSDETRTTGVLQVLGAAAAGYRRVRQRQSLYRQGDCLQSLYRIRCGTFKTVTGVSDGCELVDRIAFPGEVLGFEGLTGQPCTSSAVALEDSEVALLPVRTVRALALERPDWHDALCLAMSDELHRQQSHMVVLGTLSTEARVAAFLLEHTCHLKTLGYSQREFHLRLTRAEIGSYLGLTLETISRTFSAFQKRGWIRVSQRHVQIDAPDELAACATQLRRR